MVYFDNAATSRFKPKRALDALFFDVTHSANAGRSGHKESLEKTFCIEQCREYLAKMLGASDGYDVIFTKNCTEALNLALFGGVKRGARVVTSQNEHNSVLRPLFKMKKDGAINLTVLPRDENGRIRISDIEQIASNADCFVFGGACNVTGAINDVERIGKIAKKHGVTLIVDGAQSVPYIDTDMSRDNIAILACPGHKGLHGVQGTGFLIVRNDVSLKPLLYGGTGTFSDDLYPQIETPDSFEAGTQFSGGIACLHKAAQWTFENIEESRKNIVRLSKNLIYGLNTLGVKVYTRDVDVGVVAFNFGTLDSSLVADRLNDFDICVRGGLHCAPLVHKSLGTLSQGAVRVSFGCDNTQKELTYFLGVLDKILRTLDFKA